MDDSKKLDFISKTTTRINKLQQENVELKEKIKLLERKEEDE